MLRNGLNLREPELKVIPKHTKTMPSDISKGESIDGKQRTGDAKMLAFKKWGKNLVCGIASLLIISFSVHCGASQPSERAIEFLTNVYTGKPMQEEDWLTKKARSASAFRAHGGLDVMTKQSTARANRYGGLKTVTVLSVKKTRDGYRVRAKVEFKESPANSKSAAVAAKEPMVWSLTEVKENGIWKIYF
jgi:hypothetical protein